MNRVFWVKSFSRFESDPEPTLYFLVRKPDRTLFLESRPVSLLRIFDFDFQEKRVLTSYSDWENNCFREVIDSIKVAFVEYPLELGLGEYQLLSYTQLLIAIWKSGKKFNTTRVLDELVRIFSVISTPTSKLAKVGDISRIGPRFQDEAKN